MSKLGWLQKVPIMSLLFAAAIAAVSLPARQRSDLVDNGLRSDPGVGARVPDPQSRARGRRSRRADPGAEMARGDAFRFGRGRRRVRRSTPLRACLPGRKRVSGRTDRPGLHGTDEGGIRPGDLASSTRTLPDETISRMRSSTRRWQASFWVWSSCCWWGAPLERAWGSPIYAAFVIGAIPAVAYAYRALDASSGVPWSGAAGLAGALLGAYLHPWARWTFHSCPVGSSCPYGSGVESIVVRGFWLDDLGSVPWATFCRWRSESGHSLRAACG